MLKNKEVNKYKQYLVIHIRVEFNMPRKTIRVEPMNISKEEQPVGQHNEQLFLPRKTKFTEDNHFLFTFAFELLNQFLMDNHFYLGKDSEDILLQLVSSRNETDDIDIDIDDVTSFSALGAFKTCVAKHIQCN